MQAVELNNRQVRRALLALNGLAPPLVPDDRTATSGPACAREMVRRLGFVQVDAICAVERPQYQILFSREPRFEHRHLDRLLERDRHLFENWTHDAAILPVESYPFWRHYFARFRRFEAHPGYRRYFSPVTPAETRRVLRRITADGPLMPRDIPSAKARLEPRADRRNDAFPSPSIAKLAMEYLWRIGKLAVSRREGRQKVYDLAERVIPDAAYRKRVSAREYRDWACREALGRMVCGSPSRIARFFDAISTRTAARWCSDTRRNGLVPVVWAHADGRRSKPTPGLTEVVERVRDLPAPPRRLRLLNPFDPLIHDRERTRQVFGFDYTVEIWVPPAKRRYGYYVLPILEGERFTGRLDARVDRKRGTLTVAGLWWEDRVKPTPARLRALERELRHLAAFCGAKELVFARGHDRR